MGKCNENTFDNVVTVLCIHRLSQNYMAVQSLSLVTGLSIASLIPQLRSPAPFFASIPHLYFHLLSLALFQAVPTFHCFDVLQYAKTEGEVLGAFFM